MTEIIPVKFRASPTQILGWINTNVKPAAKQIENLKLAVDYSLHMASQEMELGEPEQGKLLIGFPLMELCTLTL